MGRPFWARYRPSRQADQLFLRLFYTPRLGRCSNSFFRLICSSTWRTENRAMTRTKSAHVVCTTPAFFWQFSNTSCILHTLEQSYGEPLFIKDVDRNISKLAVPIANVWMPGEALETWQLSPAVSLRMISASLDKNLASSSTDFLRDVLSRIFIIFLWRLRVLLYELSEIISHRRLNGFVFGFESSCVKQYIASLYHAAADVRGTYCDKGWIQKWKRKTRKKETNEILKQEKLVVLWNDSRKIVK